MPKIIKTETRKKIEKPKLFQTKDGIIYSCILNGTNCTKDIIKIQYRRGKIAYDWPHASHNDPTCKVLLNTIQKEVYRIGHLLANYEVKTKALFSEKVEFEKKVLSDLVGRSNQFVQKDFKSRSHLQILNLVDIFDATGGLQNNNARCKHFCY